MALAAVTYDWSCRSCSGLSPPVLNSSTGDAAVRGSCETVDRPAPQHRVPSGLAARRAAVQVRERHLEETGLLRERHHRLVRPQSRIEGDRRIETTSWAASSWPSRAEARRRACCASSWSATGRTAYCCIKRCTRWPIARSRIGSASPSRPATRRERSRGVVAPAVTGNLTRCGREITGSRATPGSVAGVALTGGG